MFLRCIQVVVCLVVNSFKSWEVVLYMNVTLLVYPFTSWCISGFFQFGAIMNKTAMKVHMHAILWPYIFISLGETLRVQWLGNMVSVCLTYKILHTVLQCGCTFYISVNHRLEFQLFHIFANTWHCQVLNVSHPSECTVLSHWSFNFQFPDDYWRISFRELISWYMLISWVNVIKDLAQGRHLLISCFLFKQFLKHIFFLEKDHVSVILVSLAQYMTHDRY